MYSVWTFDRQFALYLHRSSVILTLSFSPFNIDSAEILWLYSNQLSGPIPTEIGSLANLERLALYGNQLSGPIPVELGGLTRLSKYGHLGDSLHFIILILLFCGIDTFSFSQCL